MTIVNTSELKKQYKSTSTNPTFRDPSGNFYKELPNLLRLMIELYATKLMKTLVDLSTTRVRTPSPKACSPTHGSNHTFLLQTDNVAFQQGRSDDVQDIDQLSKEEMKLILVANFLRQLIMDADSIGSNFLVQNRDPNNAALSEGKVASLDYGHAFFTLIEKHLSAREEKIMPTIYLSPTSPEQLLVAFIMDKFDRTLKHDTHSPIQDGRQFCNEEPFIAQTLVNTLCKLAEIDETKLQHCLLDSISEILQLQQDALNKAQADTLAQELITAITRNMASVSKRDRYAALHPLLSSKTFRRSNAGKFCKEIIQRTLLWQPQPTDPSLQSLQMKISNLCQTAQYTHQTKEIIDIIQLAVKASHLFFNRLKLAKSLIQHNQLTYDHQLFKNEYKDLCRQYGHDDEAANERDAIQWERAFEEIQATSRLASSLSAEAPNSGGRHSPSSLLCPADQHQPPRIITNLLRFDRL